MECCDPDRLRVPPLVFLDAAFYLKACVCGEESEQCVCARARACGGLSLPPSHFDSSTLRIRVTGTSDK